MRAMNSPASLAEGIKEVRSPGRTKERKGAGGGLGIKPHYNLAYDESNKSLVFYPLTPLRSRQIGITLPAEVPFHPLTSMSTGHRFTPPSMRGGGVWLRTWIVPQDDGVGKEES